MDKHDKHNKAQPKVSGKAGDKKAAAVAAPEAAPTKAAPAEPAAKGKSSKK